MLIMFLSCIIPASCATVNVNSTLVSAGHRYSETNGFVAPYVEQWMDLAKEHGLYFRHSVDIGFTNIGGTSAGLTRYEAGFREIDIDSQYWNSSSETQKNVLVWHELAHAYCYRFHDYGKNREYGDDIVLAVKKQNAGGPGFYSDSCPKSLMFPIVLSDSCFKKYYFNYIDEMFENCIPY